MAGLTELSVIIPIYNERASLREVVRHVLAVPLDLELLCVDDCSTDGSREMLSQLQTEYPQIRIFPSLRIRARVLPSGKVSSKRGATS